MTREEIITEARRKHDAGDFNRQIVTRTPADFHTDAVELDCGHQALDVRRVTGRDVKQQTSCGHCAADWIKAAEAE